MAQPQTLAQKLIAAACGRETVAEGEIVTCAVDLAMFHDSSGPRRLKPMLEELGAQKIIHGRIGATEMTVAFPEDVPLPTNGASVSLPGNYLHFFDPESGKRLA